MDWLKELQNQRKQDVAIQRRQLIDEIEQVEAMLKKAYCLDSMVVRLMKDLGVSGLFQKPRNSFWNPWIVRSNLKDMELKLSQDRRLLRRNLDLPPPGQYQVIRHKAEPAWSCGYTKINTKGNSYLKHELTIVLSGHLGNGFEVRRFEHGTTKHCDLSESSLKSAISEVLLR
jgi:hypothetical protein